MPKRRQATDHPHTREGVGFASLKFSEELLERCWIPDGRYSACIAASPEIAEREARGRIDWLRDRSDDG